MPRPLPRYKRSGIVSKLAVSRFVKSAASIGSRRTQRRCTLRPTRQRTMDEDTVMTARVVMLTSAALVMLHLLGQPSEDEIVAKPLASPRTNATAASKAPATPRAKKATSSHSIDGPLHLPQAFVPPHKLSSPSPPSPTTVPGTSPSQSALARCLHRCLPHPIKVLAEVDPSPSHRAASTPSQPGTPRFSQLPSSPPPSKQWHWASPAVGTPTMPSPQQPKLHLAQPMAKRLPSAPQSPQSVMTDILAPH